MGPHMSQESPLHCFGMLMECFCSQNAERGGKKCLGTSSQRLKEDCTSQRAGRKMIVSYRNMWVKQAGFLVQMSQILRNYRACKRCHFVLGYAATKWEILLRTVYVILLLATISKQKQLCYRRVPVKFKVLSKLQITLNRLFLHSRPLPAK